MKVSIVTVSYNAAATIADTVASVHRQSHVDLEHLVIDGGSSDGTLEIVRGMPNRVTQLISERDGGLYDAMNKGLRLASGDVIAFLNADDWYASSSSVALAAVAFGADTGLVYGDLDFVTGAPPHEIKRVWRDSQRSAGAFAWGWQPAHPSTFMRTSLLRDLGGFDTRFRIAADYAMFVRCFLVAKAKATHTPNVLTNMRLGGVSTSGVASIAAANRECLVALNEAGAKLPRLTVALKLARKVFQLRGRVQT